MKKKILLLLSVIILATTAITAPTVAQADTVETTTAEKPSYKVTTIKAKTMYTTKKCNVRKEPSAKSKSVGTLKKNQKVTVIGKTKVKGKLWCQIKTKKGNVKFVLASKLCTYKVTAIKAKTMYTTKKCNVRKEPSAKAKSLGTLNKNQTVTVIGKTKVKGKLWYQIKTKKGNVKFVSASVLTTQKKETPKQETKPSNNDKDTAKSQKEADKIHQQRCEELMNDPDFLDMLYNSNISFE